MSRGKLVEKRLRAKRRIVGSVSTHLTLTEIRRRNLKFKTLDVSNVGSDNQDEKFNGGYRTKITEHAGHRVWRFILPDRSSTGQYTILKGGQTYIVFSGMGKVSIAKDGKTVTKTILDNDIFTVSTDESVIVTNTSGAQLEFLIVESVKLETKVVSASFSSDDPVLVYRSAKVEDPERRVVPKLSTEERQAKAHKLDKAHGRRSASSRKAHRDNVQPEFSLPQIVEGINPQPVGDPG